jgi:DNA-binding MarR family transcriptional regulator
MSKPARARKAARANPALGGLRPRLPGPGERSDGASLATLLRQAQAATRLTLERALAEIGVTPPQFTILSLLRSHPGLSGADLARVAALTPQTTGVIIRNLERKGTIRKTPHPVHGRVLQWSLTGRGTALLGQCRRHVTAQERRLMAGLSGTAKSIIRRWLIRLAEQVLPDS